MLIGPATGDDQVAIILGGATDVIGVVRRFHPATAVAEEFKLELFSRAEDVLDGDTQFETFGTGDANRTQDPALHVDGLTPIIEQAGHADRTLSDLRTEGLPEKEMHAAGFQPMPRTQGPGTHVGRLEQSQAGGRIQGERRQVRTHPVGGEYDEAGDLCLPARAG